MSRYDGENIIHYTKGEGFCNHSINTIFEDSQGHLWFGTNGGGVSKYDGKTTSNIGIDEDSISEKDLERLINEMKNKKADKNLLKSIRSIIGIKTISTRNAIKLLKVLKEEYLLMELVIALYPCLNDPHNIEILINHILSSEKQNECRIRLIKLPNFYFDIVGEESQGACCCTIF